jgi:hypothetical protein
MHDGAVRESKLLWVLGNYARFIRPGAVRVECEVVPTSSYVDGVLASAYRGASGELIAVIVNLSGQEVECDLGREGIAEVYTTFASANLEKSRQKADEVKVPARGVSTCVMK